MLIIIDDRQGWTGVFPVIGTAVVCKWKSDQHVRRVQRRLIDVLSCGRSVAHRSVVIDRLLVAPDAAYAWVLRVTATSDHPRRNASRCL